MAPSDAVAAQPTPSLTLPVLVFGIVEVRRLKRELQALEEFMAQAALREAGRQPALPRVSRLLDALAAENHLNLLQPAARQQLKAFLDQTEHKAPTIHISFAADPSSAFTAKLVAWLRSSVASNTLLSIGLQPTIAAGCIVRTTNKLFDLSLRQRFADSQKLLLESFETEAPLPPARLSAVPQAADAAGSAPQGGAPAPQQPGVPAMGIPASQQQAAAQQIPGAAQ